MKTIAKVALIIVLFLFLMWLILTSGSISVTYFQTIGMEIILLVFMAIVALLFRKEGNLTIANRVARVVALIWLIYIILLVTYLALGRLPHYTVNTVNSLLAGVLIALTIILMMAIFRASTLGGVRFLRILINIFVLLFVIFIVLFVAGLLLGNLGTIVSSFNLLLFLFAMVFLYFIARAGLLDLLFLLFTLEYWAITELIFINPVNLMWLYLIIVMILTVIWWTWFINLIVKSYRGLGALRLY